MILKSQRRIAAQLLKVGLNRIWFDPERLDEIKESITKADIRSLIQDGAIQKKPETGISRGRKRAWILKIRAQRKLLGRLRQKKVITPKTYSLLYRKAKGGFFRSTRHIHLYAQEHKLEHEKK